MSDELKDDLVVAFARFGICPSVGRYETTFKQRTGERRYPFWRLTICNISPWSPLEWDKGVSQSLNARRTGDLVWAAVTDDRRDRAGWSRLRLLGPRSRELLGGDRESWHTIPSGLR